MNFSVENIYDVKELLSIWGYRGSTQIYTRNNADKIATFALLTRNDNKVVTVRDG